MLRLETRKLLFGLSYPRLLSREEKVHLIETTFLRLGVDTVHRWDGEELDGTVDEESVLQICWMNWHFMLAKWYSSGETYKPTTPG